MRSDQVLAPIGRQSASVAAAADRAESELEAFVAEAERLGIDPASIPGAGAQLQLLVDSIAFARLLVEGGHFDQWPDVAGTYANALEWAAQTFSLGRRMVGRSVDSDRKAVEA